MIIIDTNVLSEPTKDRPNAAVLKWLALQDVTELYFTATSLAEVRYGLESLPNGRRKTTLQTATAELISALFGSRVLPFDEDAALAYGALIPCMEALRKKPSVFDGQIAAIALVHGFTVATRDTDPFLASGLNVIDPWKA